MSAPDDERRALLRAAVTVIRDRQRALDIVTNPDLSEADVIANLKQCYEFDDLEANSVLPLQLRSFTAVKQANLERELGEIT